MKIHWTFPLVERIMDRYPGLIRGQPWQAGVDIIVPPVGPFYKSLYFARWGAQVNFKFGFAILPLFEPLAGYRTSYGDRLHDPKTGHTGAFRLDNIDVLNVIDRASYRGIKTLTAVGSADDFLDYLENVGNRFTMGTDACRPWALAFAGRFNDLRKVLQEHEARCKQFRETDPIGSRSYREDCFLQLRQYLADPPVDASKKITELLQANMVRSVRILKLEKYWQPNPYREAEN